MTKRKETVGTICGVLFFLSSTVVLSDELQTAPPTTPVRHEVYKVSPTEYLSPTELKHPLVPALLLGYEGIQYLQQHVRDYEGVLISRERINGKLRDYESMNVKIRRRQEKDGKVTVPFSVYLYFNGPKKLKGREVLFVQGRDDNKMLARNGGSSHLQDITMSLDPLSPRAMRDHRYPITEIGMEVLARRLIEVGHESLQIDRERQECEVKSRDGAKINGQTCRVIQVKFPARRDKLRFHLARIFVEQDRPIPIRYEAYGWPSSEGAAPPLLEEYTYLNVKLNRGLTDLDFDRDNPAYRFYRSEQGQNNSELRTDASGTDARR